MFKTVPQEIKEEVLRKIKEGQKAPDLASQYGIKPKTIYGWLSRLVRPEITFMEYSHLKRENEDLKRIIGQMALDLSAEKKRRISQARYQ